MLLAVGAEANNCYKIFGFFYSRRLFFASLILLGICSAFVD